jgi:hypothetical protein
LAISAIPARLVSGGNHQFRSSSRPGHVIGRQPLAVCGSCRAPSPVDGNRIRSEREFLPTGAAADTAPPDLQNPANRVATTVPGSSRRHVAASQGR